MVKSAALALLLLAGCSSATFSEEPLAVVEGEDAAPPSADATAADVDGGVIVDDAGTPAEEDAAAVEDAGDASADEDAGASVDSGTPADASSEDDADAAQPPADSGTADAGPCVDSVQVPTSPNWTIWARYALGPNTTKAVPYYCPNGVDGNSCKFALGNPASGYVYPAPGACRIAVPAKCLPCTGGVTEW